MWKKFENLKAIADTGILLIIRLDDEREALAVAEAAIAGGIKALEVTLSVPNALGIISTLSKKYKQDGIVIGAGTVLDAETARAAILAGADLLVSPNVTAPMLQVANRYQAVSVCGAYTPTEVVSAIEHGADIVKLFPAETLGPSYVKTIRAPLEQAPIAPTGGVTPENVKDWFAAGCVSVGVGSYISKAAQTDGDYQKVTQAAQTFLKAVADARSALS